MTTRSINDQVHTIKSATEKASSSKETAIAFLRKAGIIDVVAVGKAKEIFIQQEESKRATPKTAKDKNTKHPAVKKASPKK
jgi:hypothetical protein